MTRSTPPRRHRLRPPVLGPADVERPRLTTAILATPPAGTCLLTAPAGYGATTAVAQALANQQAVAWVGLDSLDATPAHLHAQLEHALAEQAPEGRPGATGQRLDDDELGPIAAFVDALGHTPLDWIVLDGFSADDHVALMPAISYLVANMPVHVRIALTTHDSLHLVPVSASDRRLVLLEAEQLRATDDEAAQIAIATAPGLDVGEVEDIATAASGLVAAIRMASRHAAQHPTDNAGQWLLTTGANALLGPWLDALPSEPRTFLEDTAFLDQLSGPLCDVVRQAGGSLQQLIALESHGGYLVPVPPVRADDATRWWSRHPLLTAALSQRVNVDSDTERHLRAATWFEANRDLESTMRHLLAAGRLEQAAETLRGNENSLFERGRADRLAEWYAALPPDSWGQTGWHLLRVGWGQAMSCDVSAGAATMAQLRAHLATAHADAQEQRALMAEVSVLAGYLAALTGDTATAVSSARTAIDLFGDRSEVNSQQIAPIVLIRALLWEGDVASARRELTRIRFQPFPTAILREVALSTVVAQCLVDEGRVTEAQREVSRALGWLTDHSLVPHDVRQFGIMIASGAQLLESGDPRGAADSLDAAAEAALMRGNVGEGVHAHLWLARARLCLGHPAQALADVLRARHALHESAPTSSMLGRVDLTEAFVRFVGGDIVRAERLLQRVPASDERALMWARVTMHRQGNSLRRSLIAVDGDTPRTAVDKQILLAMLAMKRSTALAEGHLLRAADLAEQHGQHLALLGCSKELLAFADVLAARTSHDHLARLVRTVTALDDHPLTDHGPRQATLAAAGPPLSPGELELITFLPRRDSNADIARQLGVSVNTVKTRLYRLYRKLGVTSRDGAVDVARDRGLVS